MSYLINKNHKSDTIVTLCELEGYKFRPKKLNDSYVKVSEVTIVDRVMIDKILSMKFEKTFKRLVSLALGVINDEDATDSDVQIVLDEAVLIKQILENRYQKFLSHEKEELFLKKLRVIDNEMRIKQMAIKQKAMYLDMMQEKGMSRGR